MLSFDFIRDSSFPFSECRPGDQSLIAVEIVAALKAHKCAALWLPFSIGPLARYARSHGIVVRDKIGFDLARKYEIDSLYLGTPTIVANKKLFEASAPGDWTKHRERKCMKETCAQAASIGARVIITGLGSGDVTVANRVKDMALPGWSKPKVICMKDFGQFVDWLLLTERNPDAKE